MGYTTHFKGRLDFVSEPTSNQLNKLNDILGKDCRDYPEWGYENYTWIDLELTGDRLGLQWDGSEKTSCLTEKINIVLELMQKEFPEFRLKGRLLAQGESIGDTYIIDVDEDGAEEYIIHESDLNTVVNVKINNVKSGLANSSSNINLYEALHNEVCTNFIEECKNINKINLDKSEFPFDEIYEYINNLQDCYVKGYLMSKMDIFLEHHNDIDDFIHMINTVLNYNFKIK